MADGDITRIVPPYMRYCARDMTAFELVTCLRIAQAAEGAVLRTIAELGLGRVATSINPNTSWGDLERALRDDLIALGWSPPQPKEVSDG